MARTTASTPLEPGPPTELSSTNNVDRMTKASLVARSKRSNSELSVDGLALLASTVIAEWDRNGQHNHRRKILELSEMSVVSREDQWLEKYNKLKQFYQKHGHTQATFSNCEDKSLAHWVSKQRHHCKKESRIKLLNAMQFTWSALESSEDQWLEKYNQLKEFYQKHGHSKVTFSNCEDKSLVVWATKQRRCCKIKSRIEFLNAIVFVWTSPENRWLEKYDQLKEFYQKHGRVQMTYSNCADKSLVRWAYNQRCYCKLESRLDLLNAIGFVWSPLESFVDRWLEKYNQLKEFYQRYGRVPVTSSNCCEDKSLVLWVTKQRRYCKMESRIELLNAIGFVWSASKGRGING